LQQTIITEMQKNVSLYERLEVPDCINEYGVDYLSNRRNVIVVTTAQGLNNSIMGALDWSYDVIQNSWVCGCDVNDTMVLEPKDINDFDCIVADALNSLPIAIGNYSIDYCLSERVPDVCRLQFSLHIMLIVILCNTVKLICILLTLMKRDETLITMGDAIASFLCRPDPMTRGMGTATMADFKSAYWPSSPQPRKWSYVRYFRWQAVGPWRWAIVNVL
jgi:hypothetical protein